MRNLGIIIDETMSLDDHVSHISKLCFLYLRAISRQRRYLTRRGAKMLTEAYVLSRLGYCASLLHSITIKQEHRLNRIINYSVRLVLLLGRGIPIDSHLRNLAWLTTRKRAIFRLCILAYFSIKLSSPLPLSNLLLIRPPPSESLISTRSSVDQYSVVEPRTRLKFGDKAFRVAAAKQWNALPIDVRKCESLRKFKNSLWLFVCSL